MNSNQPLPEEYIDGYVMFMGNRFVVDERVLIPRLETEELVKYCLKFLEKNPQIQTVADIGTGSGIIPISIAAKMERSLRVFATDMSQDALDLAGENSAKIATNTPFVKGEKNSEENKGDFVSENPPALRTTSFTKEVSGITFLQGDLLQPLIRELRNSVPEEILITANLPYVREVEINSGLIHEPRMAFLGGVQTGFELYERFFDQLMDWKSRPRKCHVVIEFGLWQRDIAETVFMSHNCSYTFFADLRGIERFAHICLSR